MLQENNKLGMRPWFMWGFAALVFFTVYFPRVSPSVMQHELMASFHITGFGFGLLTSSFLYAYVPMQLPVGMLIDRFGAQRLLYLSAIVAAVGCAVFSMSQHVLGAGFGRFLTGLGGSFDFVAAMKLATEWFPAHMFGLLAGLTQALGMLGAAFGEAPVALAVDTYGWRPTMLVMGLALVILAVLVFVFVRDRVSKVKCTLPKLGLIEGLKIVLKNKQCWLNAGYLGFTYAPVMALAEAWGVSFLQAGYSLSKTSAAMAVSLMFIGWGVGGPIVGFLSDRMRRRKPMMIMSSIFGCVLVSIIIYSHGMSLTLLYVLMFIVGFTNTGLAVSYALASEVCERRIAGTSVAFANMASIVIGMVLEPAIGRMLDMRGGTLIDGVYHYATSDYRVAFVILPFCCILSLIFALFVKETHCRPVDM
jgi:MFS family permease